MRLGQVWGLLTAAFLLLVLYGCDEAKKPDSMVEAEKRIRQLKEKAVNETAPEKFYQAKRELATAGRRWEKHRFVDADYHASRSVHYCDIADVVAKARRNKQRIRGNDVSILKIEKQIISLDNEIKDLIIRYKNMTLAQRNELLKNRAKKIAVLNKKYSELYQKKLKDETKALKNIEQLSQQINDYKKELKGAEESRRRLSQAEKKRLAKLREKLESASKQYKQANRQIEDLQKEKENLSGKVNAEKLRNKAIRAISNAGIIKVKSVNMGAKKGASAKFRKADSELGKAKSLLQKKEYLESRVLAITAQNLFNDAIKETNRRYLAESKRLKRARREIREAFGRLKDTEIKDEQGRVKIIMRGVLFAYNKAELNDKFHEKLEKLAVILKRYKEFPVNIEGHTDSIGKDSYNLNLSSDRAGAVAKYLIDRCGLSSKRITALGYGESRPVADNSTKKGRVRNRRVEIIIMRNIKKGQ